MPVDLKMADKLWDLANLVTGFAIAQNLALTYTMAKGDLPMRGRLQHLGAFVGTVVFTIGYFVAVRDCGREGRVLDADNACVWCWVTHGREVAIIMFTVVTVITIGIHWWLEVRKVGAPCSKS